MNREQAEAAIAKALKEAAEAAAISHASKAFKKGDAADKTKDETFVTPAITNFTSVTGATAAESAVAHNTFRYFDGDMHYSEPALNVLVRALQRSSTLERERFFATTMGVRRRMDRKWQETPLAKVNACTMQTNIVFFSCALIILSLLVSDLLRPSHCLPIRCSLWMMSTQH